MHKVVDLIFLSSATTENMAEKELSIRHAAG